ncbi:hypothetical protein [Pseudonocardia adelaidensis]|uniref:hypothetical protein n=1 Tax=Pseudonocardia adelaidensis TaxID=648754 RepID=UPI0031EA09AC
MRRQYRAQRPQARGLAVLHGGRVGDGRAEGGGDPLAGEQVDAGQAAGERDDLGPGGQREQVADGRAAHVAQPGGEGEGHAGGLRVVDPGGTVVLGRQGERGGGPGGARTQRMPQGSWDAEQNPGF